MAAAFLAPIAACWDKPLVSVGTGMRKNGEKKKTNRLELQDFLLQRLNLLLRRLALLYLIVVLLAQLSGAGENS